MGKTGMKKSSVVNLRRSRCFFCNVIHKFCNVIHRDRSEGWYFIGNCSPRSFCECNVLLGLISYHLTIQIFILGDYEEFVRIFKKYWWKNWDGDNF